VDWIISEFKKDQGIDLSKDRMALQRLKEAAEKAKCELSSVTETEINLPLSRGRRGPEAPGAEADARAVRAAGQRSLRALDSAARAGLKDAGLKLRIDESSWSEEHAHSKIQEIVKPVFGKEPHKGVNPDEVVAIGAAIQPGCSAARSRTSAPRRHPPVAGVETLGGVMTKLIERNTTIPTRKSETFSTATTTRRAWRSTSCRESRSSPGTTGRSGGST